MESPLTTKAVILQALLQGPTYGSEIIARIKGMTKQKMTLHSGSVYPALKSMLQEGIIVQHEEPESGRACYYELTTEGKKEARKQRDMVRIVFFPAEATWRNRKAAKKGKAKKRSSSSISMAS